MRRFQSTIRSCVASINQIKLRSTSPLQHTTTTMGTGPLAKCTHCRTYLFPCHLCKVRDVCKVGVQEVSKAMWCCKKGHMPYAIVIQAVDTANRRIQKWIGSFSDARQFRMHSRRRSLNLACSFAAFGIKYGAVDQLSAPPYFMKVNGISPNCRAVAIARAL
jgi:hypothetical protein